MKILEGCTITAGGSQEYEDMMIADILQIKTSESHARFILEITDEAVNHLAYCINLVGLLMSEKINHASKEDFFEYKKRVIHELFEDTEMHRSIRSVVLYKIDIIDGETTFVEKKNKEEKQ